MRRMIYIHEQKKWPIFHWDENVIGQKLSDARFHQGLLLGKMRNLGFGLKDQAILQILTTDIMTSSNIEGENLDKEQVRSSVARRLGLPYDEEIFIERNVDGIVEMVMDATHNYLAPLSKKRLFSWQASLFPGGYSGMHTIHTGSFRKDQNGPMQVISGPVGMERIHYRAPDASRIPEEMDSFIQWFNRAKDMDGVLAPGIAHIWFLSIHPFEDGNGRIARALTDMLLARDEHSPNRFYSISSQIQKNRKEYYQILEKTQKGNLDITAWLLWYLQCFKDAIGNTEEILSSVFAKADFWQKYSMENFSDRQKKVLNLYMDGWKGKLTSSKWARLAKTSQDTANRDILELLDKGILIRNGSGRSTHYVPNCGENRP